MGEGGGKRLHSSVSRLMTCSSRERKVQMRGRRLKRSAKEISPTFRHWNALLRVRHMNWRKKRLLLLQRVGRADQGMCPFSALLPS